MKKQVLLILMITLFSSVLVAQNVTWTNDSGLGDNTWGDDFNWDTTVQPTSTQNAVITGDQDCNLVTGDIKIAKLEVSNYSGTLTVKSGASLETLQDGQWSSVGWVGVGKLVVEAGASVTTSSHLWLNFNDNSESYVDVYGNLTVGQRFAMYFLGEDPTHTPRNTLPGAVKVFDNGVLNISQYGGGALRADHPGTLTIYQEGTLLINGDRSAELAQDVTDMRLIADNFGSIEIEYNAGADKTYVSHNARTIAAPVLSVKKNTLLNLEVFPNPASDKITIKSNTSISNLKLYSALGRLVIENSEKSFMDISSLSSGYYILKVTDINGSLGIKKVVKN